MSKFSSRNPILSSNIPHLSNLDDLIILCYLTNNQVSFPCNIKLSTQVEHILPFATKGKALSFEKDKKCFNLLHLFLIPTPIVSKQNVSTTFQDKPLNSMPGIFCTVLVSWDAQVQHLSSLSRLSQLNLFCNRHLEGRGWDYYVSLFWNLLRKFSCFPSLSSIQNW